MKAEERLRRMAARYESARTYADQGVVRTTMVRGPEREVDELVFRTVFERPLRLRFEASLGSGERFAVWQASSPARFFWTRQGRLETQELPMAIAAATGISGGAVGLVPGLLLPALLRFAGLQLQEPVDRGTTSVDGTACVRIDGQQGGCPFSVWLGAEDLLIRRAFHARRFDAEQRAVLAMAAQTGGNDPEMEQALEDLESTSDFELETEIQYTPALDGPIDPSGFDDAVVMDRLRSPPGGVPGG